MGLTVKILNAGVLSGSITSLYPGDTVLPGKGAIVKNIIITNKNTTGAVATINLYVQKQTDTTNYLISPLNVQLPAGMQLVFDTEISLQMNTGPDRIRGVVTGGGLSAGDVQFVINGLERDN